MGLLVGVLVEVCGIVVEAGEGGLVEEGVVATVLDARFRLHADDVRALVLRHREAGERQEPSYSRKCG